MKRIRFIYLFLAVTLLASCAKEELITPDIVDSSMIPLNISGAIDQQQTKVNEDGFVDNDAVGLYAVNYTDNNTQPGVLKPSGNQADNVKYVFSNHKWTPVKSVYYKDVNTNVDIYLYYPHQENITDVDAGGFEVRKDQSAQATASSLCGYEASDFLWGKSAGVVPSEQSVKVNLSHKFTAVKVTLQKGTGFGEDEFEGLSKSIIVTNTTRKATINYSTGEVTPLGGPQADGIVMCPQGDGSFRAIVIPQGLPASTKLFSITIDGIAYGFTYAQALEYKSGKQHDFTITINKKSPSGDYELELTSCQITDWTEDLNTHGGEARQYYVVNVETPGTLGQIIKGAGKNPDKIRNLKITGTISNRDYYFMRDSMAILEAVNLKEAVTYAGDNQIAHCRKSGNTESYIEQYGLPDEELGNELIWYNKETGIIPHAAFSGKQTLCYFTFPEYVIKIGNSAFGGTTLSGALIIPEDVIIIDGGAFGATSIISVTFNNVLERIGSGAFSRCSSLTGNLVFPESLKYIGTYAFQQCSFTGRLMLPDNLEEIGECAFYMAGDFSDGLTIPDKITLLSRLTFSGTHFSGTLNLNNIQVIDDNCFNGSKFSGELIIPDGMISIPSSCFYMCNFSKVIMPESLRTIGNDAFWRNQKLQEIEFKEGLISIGQNAFEYCRTLLSLSLPSTLQTIQSGAFQDCYYISNISCSADEPPTVQSDAFNGVAKDNFTVEVPAASVKKYQAESGWSDFKRIAAHYDFSISRERMRALNGEMTRTYTLRCPANYTWSIQSKPDWVTVSPESGTGKTDVTVSISEMPRTNDTFEVNEGTFNNPVYKNYKGRADTLIFLLDEKNYTCSMDIEQYDYDYSDGYVKTYQTANTGAGIDIVFIGDGYDAKDIAKGTFLTNAEAGYGHLFDLEPYKTYKDYFNVKAVISLSDESGIGTVNTIVDTKFGCYFTQNRILCPAPEPCFTWAKKANPSMDLTKSLTIMMMNTSTYEGITMMYGDGSAIALCPVSTEAYPYDYRGLIQHEAGGHGFGKLGDEYIYHNAFIQTCNCLCCEHPQSDSDSNTSYGRFKTLGWYRNLSMSSDPNQVPWAHLLYHPSYSDYVDMYEGGYMHTRGMYRSEATSCMNNNIPYYSAISRQAIVERIMECSGGTFDIADFYAKDKDTFGTITKSGFPTSFDRTCGVNPDWNRGSEEGSVIYMGDHPDYSKIK